MFDLKKCLVLLHGPVSQLTDPNIWLKIDLRDVVDLTKKTYLFDPTKWHLYFCRGRFWFWFFPFFIWFLLLQRSARQKSVRASSRSRSRDNLAGKGFRDTRSRFSTFQIVERHKKHILNLSNSSETLGAYFEPLKQFIDTRSRFSTFQIVQRHKKHILNLSNKSET